jgi:hypothetical protein
MVSLGLLSVCYETTKFFASTILGYGFAGVMALLDDFAL